MKASLVVALRILIIGWASVWVVALPLFHTHLPGVLDKPVGLPHTVFSSDLPGEFSAFSHRTTTDEAEFSALAFHSQELGFVTSASLDDGKRKPLGHTASLFLAPVTPRSLPAIRLLEDLPALQPDSIYAPASHGLRAPPGPLSA
jgi:hypothetical protein